MSQVPTVFVVFESRMAWEQENPELARCGYGRFLEDDESISLIIEEIQRSGLDVVTWPYTSGGFAALLESLGRVAEPILWNLTDGYEFYTGANLPAFVELAGVPHIGSSSYTQMLCQNKHHLKAVAQAIGIPVAQGVSFSAEAKDPLVVPPEISSPYFVKPTRLDNSIGDQLVSPVCANVSIALTAVKRLFDAGITDVLVEEFLPGNEFSVVAVNNGRWIIECARVFYDMENYFSSTVKDNDKYRIEFIKEPITREITIRTMDLAKAINLKDYFRADFRCALNGQPKLLEVNSGPFLVSNIFDKLAIQHFGSRPTMFQSIIMQSFQRQWNRIRENHAKAH